MPKPTIELYSATWNNQQNSISQTVNIPAGLSDSLLLVAVQWNNDGLESITSATIGGQALNFLANSIQSDDAREDIFYLVNPPAGSQTITINFNSTTLWANVLGSIVLSGVNTAAPFGQVEKAASNATGSSPMILSPQSTDNDLVFAFLEGENLESGTNPSEPGQVLLWKILQTNQSGRTTALASYLPGTSPTTQIGYSLGRINHRVLIAFAVKGSSGQQISADILDSIKNVDSSVKNIATISALIDFVGLSDPATAKKEVALLVSEILKNTDLSKNNINANLFAGDSILQVDSGERSATTQADAGDVLSGFDSSKSIGSILADFSDFVRSAGVYGANKASLGDVSDGTTGGDDQIANKSAILAMAELLNLGDFGVSKKTIAALVLAGVKAEDITAANRGLIAALSDLQKYTEEILRTGEAIATAAENLDISDDLFYHIATAAATIEALNISDNTKNSIAKIVSLYDQYLADDSAEVKLATIAQISEALKALDVRDRLAALYVLYSDDINIAEDYARQKAVSVVSAEALKTGEQKDNRAELILTDFAEVKVGDINALMLLSQKLTSAGVDLSDIAAVMAKISALRLSGYSLSDILTNTGAFYRSIYAENISFSEGFLTDVFSEVLGVLSQGAKYADEALPLIVKNQIIEDFLSLTEIAALTIELLKLSSDGEKLTDEATIEKIAGAGGFSGALVSDYIEALVSVGVLSVDGFFTGDLTRSLKSVNAFLGFDLVGFSDNIISNLTIRDAIASGDIYSDEVFSFVVSQLTGVNLDLLKFTDSATAESIREVIAPAFVSFYDAIAGSVGRIISDSHLLTFGDLFLLHRTAGSAVFDSFNFGDIAITEGLNSLIAYDKVNLTDAITKYASLNKILTDVFIFGENITYSIGIIDGKVCLIVSHKIPGNNIYTKAPKILLNYNSSIAEVTSKEPEVVLSGRLPTIKTNEKDQC